MKKFIYGFLLSLWLITGVAGGVCYRYYDTGPAQTARMRMYLRQFELNDKVAEEIRQDHNRRQTAYVLMGIGWVMMGGAFLIPLFKDKNS